MSTLLLRLAGPMQSWGINSKFEIRRTETAPSKSAVIGLLAAALGRKREDNMDDLNSLRFGVRVDLPGEIQYDYQTVKTSKSSYISRRYYISDGIFLVGFESTDDDFLQKLEKALKEPVYHLFLGRKSYLPTLPLIIGIRRTSLENALATESWLVPEWRRKKSNSLVRIITDCTCETETDMVLKDVPISFSSSKREYRNRGVVQFYVDIDPEHDINHDPMAELEEKNVSDKSTT